MTPQDIKDIESCLDDTRWVKADALKDALRQLMAENARLLAERDLPVKMRSLLTPERMAEIRGNDAATIGPPERELWVEELDRRDLLAHADTLESLLRDVAGEVWEIREAGRVAGYEDGRRAMFNFGDGAVVSTVSAVTYPPGATLATTQSPRYVHDCETCTFLGWHGECDLYHHGLPFPTVIARYGNGGPEYTSGIHLATQDSRLAEALRRATDRGLNVQS